MIDHGKNFTELGTERFLTPAKLPETNGMVQRFNTRIGNMLKTKRFDSALALKQTLMRRAHLYNTPGAARSLGEQAANAGDEGLKQIPPESVRQITVHSSGMLHSRPRRAVCFDIGRHSFLQECSKSTRSGSALLDKSPDGWTSPIPGQTYPTTSVTGMPRAVKPFRTATLTWMSAT